MAEPVTSRFLVYALTDPRSDAVRYIGKSCTGLRRPAQHGRPAALSQDHTHKGNWIRGLVAEGLSYGIVALECSSNEEAVAGAERRWIARGRAEGWPLTNICDGGEGVCGLHQTAATRQRIREALSGMKRSPKTCEKIGAAHRGLPMPDHVKSALLASNLGCKRGPLSLETRARMSLAQRGHVVTDECREKLRQANLGKTISEEARAKIGLAHRGRKRPPETGQRIASAMRGNKNALGATRSPETRRKVSLALRGYRHSPESIANMTAARRIRQQREAEAKQCKVPRPSSAARAIMRGYESGPFAPW